MKNNKSYSLKKNNIERNSKTVPKSIQSLKSFKKNEVLQKLKIRKIISPEEIQFMRMNRKMRFVMDGNKYNKIKEEKFKSTWKNYFKRNIVFLKKFIPFLPIFPMKKRFSNFIYEKKD